MHVYKKKYRKIRAILYNVIEARFAFNKRAKGAENKSD